MIEAPLKLLAITATDPIENAIGLFLDAILEPVRGEHGDEGESENESANQGEGHGVGHGMKKLSGGTGESVDGKVTGDDDGDGIENGAVDVASGGKNHFVEVVLFTVVFVQLAVDVFDHDDGAVNDDAEVDGADGEQVGGFAGGVEKDEGKEKSKRNRESGDDGCADADEKKDQNDEHERHAAKKILFNGVGGDFDEIAAIVIRTHLHVGRKKIAINFGRFFLDALKDVLRLLAAAHQDDAFNGVVVVFLFVLEPENPEARSDADDDAADILYPDRHAVAAAYDNFADVLGGLDESETADVVKLAALRVEAAPGVGVVGGELVEDLNDGQMVVVQLHGVEQD